MVSTTVSGGIRRLTKIPEDFEVEERSVSARDNSRDVQARRETGPLEAARRPLSPSSVNGFWGRWAVRILDIDVPPTAFHQTPVGNTCPIPNVTGRLACFKLGSNPIDERRVVRD